MKESGFNSILDERVDHFGVVELLKHSKESFELSVVSEFSQNN